MKIHKSLIYIILTALSVMTTNLQAQNGDQILDGIGETELITRYLFDGDAKDWSRNNLDGKLNDSKANFVDDDLFGTVLSLPADSNAFVTLPGEAVTGEESLSITGWIYLLSNRQWQHFFDFGKNSKSHFFVAPMGTNKKQGYQAGIVTEAGDKYQTDPSAIEANTWNHLAVVINVPSKSISTYVNGKLVSETKNVELDLEHVFDNDSSTKNMLYIGKSLLSDNAYLHAKLHDFRIYRIPLSEKQIARIHHNALNGEETVVNETKDVADDLPMFSKTSPQLYNEYVSSVANVEIETVVGYLPRLPRYVKGIYRNGMEGPDVRVLWPAPKDNSNVRTAGQYIITGSIAGTDLKPKAVITVKEIKENATPTRKLEVFNLDEVSLNPDLHGHNTKFIENRDKFITTLAKTNPDDFLYMFRNAFGQEQPQGAEPLGVWDTQETKLRGHATGHYLTAIAQAYASTGYYTPS